MKCIDEEYAKIAKQYPFGLSAYKCQNTYGNDKEIIIHKIDEIQKLDVAQRKYNQLKKKYPKGLPALERYYTYDDGKNSADLSIYEIVEREDEFVFLKNLPMKPPSMKNGYIHKRNMLQNVENLCLKYFQITGATFMRYHLKF